MFLCFSNWSTEGNLRKLEEKHFPHAGKLIKVFANHEDPSLKLGRKVTVIKRRGMPFEPNERYKWYNRGPWSGTDMEVYLNSFHIPEEIKQEARSLFRFADSAEMGIVELAMSSRNIFQHYEHPLNIIDGLDQARDRKRYGGLHLDIFSPPSIEHLAKIIDLESPEGILTIDESVKLIKSNCEGSPICPEGYQATKGKESQ